MTQINVKSQNRVLILHMFLFFIVWSVYALFFSDPIKAVNPYIGVLIKLLVWTLPVCLIIGLNYKANVLEYLKLKNNNWGKTLFYTGTVGGILTIWNIVSCVFLYKKGFSFDKGFSTWLSAVILIGFTEEIIFRGFLLQGLENLMKFKYATLIQSVLFLLIHFPGWYKNSIFVSPVIIGNILFIFVFALIQGWLLKKTNSLWSCILIHTINNFITIVFGI